ncbi:MAG TPA: pseudouridine synthase [Longimicrobiaceae bacterium]|nr:pseudouridine synthase [Longimicrobiaceae bacterium]
MVRRQGGRPTAEGEPVRLQVFIARSGLASRRGAEELIAEGRVWVNGESVTSPGTKVIPGVDRVEVDGEAISSAVETMWVALHKPKGYVTTRHDPYGRKTIYELLPGKLHHLFHVGRLDRDSEGILLLTNDGPGANRFLHPRFGVTKEYLVDVDGRPTAEELRRLVSGVELEDGVARAESAERMHQVDLDVWRIRVVLREGKKREVRRMLDAVGHPVRRLIRRRFGPVELGELPSGRWRVLGPTELRGLMREPGGA